MRIGHWIAVAGVLYFLVVGVNEVVTSDNATLDMLPDFGNFVGATAGAPNYTAAALDLGAAAILYYTVLHKRLIGA